MPLPGLRWRGPLVSVGAVVAAFLLRWFLRPVLGPTEAPLQIFFLAVFVSAWAGGLFTGLVASLLSVVVSYVAFFPHPDGLFSLSTADVLRVVVFLIIGVVLSVMSESRLRVVERERDGVGIPLNSTGLETPAPQRAERRTHAVSGDWP